MTHVDYYSRDNHVTPCIDDDARYNVLDMTCVDSIAVITLLLHADMLYDN